MSGGESSRHEIVGILYRNMPERKSGKGSSSRERSLEATREQGMAWIAKMKGKPLMLRHNGTLKGRPDVINEEAVIGTIKGGFLGTDDTLYVTADIDTSKPLGNQVSELVRNKVMYEMSARTEGDDFHEASIVFDGARQGSQIVLASKGEIDISTGSGTAAGTAAAMQQPPQTPVEDQLKQQLGDQGNVDLKSAIGGALMPPGQQQQQQQQQPPAPKLQLTGIAKTDEAIAKLPADEQHAIMEFFNEELKKQVKIKTEFEAHIAAGKAADKQMAAAWAEDLQRRKNGPADPQLKTRREREFVEASSFLASETGQELKSELQQLREENARLALQQTAAPSTPSAQQLQALALEQRMQKSMMERAELLARLKQNPAQSTNTSFSVSKPYTDPAFEEYKRQKAAAAAAAAAAVDPLYAQYLQEKAAAAAPPAATTVADPAYEEYKRQKAAAAAAAADPLYAQFLRDTAGGSGSSSSSGPPAPPGYQQPRDPAGKWVVEASAAAADDRSKYFLREYRIRGFEKPVLLTPLQYESLIRSEATPIVLASSTERPDNIEDTKGAPVLLNSDLAMPSCPIMLLEPSTLRMLRGDRSPAGMGFKLVGADLEAAIQRKRRSHAVPV